MEFSESFEQAAEYARSAMDRMAELGVVPHPNNFMIWFHYFSGKYPDLRRTMDILLGNQQEFTEQRCADLFQKFFTFDSEGAAINDASTRLEAEMAKILGYVGEAGGDAKAYGKILENYSSKMGDGDGDEFKAAISGVLQATQAMRSRNQKLEEKLNASTSEIDQLKNDLEDLRREALTDGLTGIANRKVFDSELRRAAMAAMEAGEPVTLMMLDIDHFKRFNDNYGHQVGDQVLKLLANTLQSCTKGQDTAARYGGEEFGVILPNTALHAAAKLGEVIRNKVGTKELINRKTGKKLGRLTVSIGVAEFVFGEPLAQLVTRADEALYLAKRTGRNKVMTQEDLSEHEVVLES